MKTLRHLFFRASTGFGTSANPRRYASSKASDPLRVLFCGSEEFSIVSLHALHQEHLRDPESIASIDVVCRPGKPVGRGLKTVREVPIAAAARDLALPLHQIDTFTGWNPPYPQGKPINLIIAVSFGLLVPPRILTGAKYGGLNVHPSMLPDFRGPAPLHHTLLSGCTTTGITLQTLHPKHFDHGTILAQISFEIPNSESITVPELTKLASKRGAEMLVQGIRDRVFVSPLQSIDLSQHSGMFENVRTAPKISPKDRQIDWSTWTADKILQRHRIIGPLWNIATSGCRPEWKEKRIIWSSGFEIASVSPELSSNGVPIIGTDDSDDMAMYIRTCDGQTLKATDVKAEGSETKPARSVATRHEMVDLRDEDKSVPGRRKFWRPLR